MEKIEDQLKQMYGANLTSQKEQLAADYEAADKALSAQKEENQKITDSNLRQTRIDAQKSAVNNEEYYAASGLTSGAKAQAKLARDNQLLSDLTTIRTAQQEADALIERQRATLAKEYESAITKAQADNDLALAKALYEQAQKEDANLLQGAAGTTGTTGTTGTVPTSSQQIQEMQAWYGVLADGIWGNNSTAAAGGKDAAAAWEYYTKMKGVLDPEDVAVVMRGNREEILKHFGSAFHAAQVGGASNADLQAYLDALYEAGILQGMDGYDIRTDRRYR